MGRPSSSIRVHGAAASIPPCHGGGDSSILSDPDGLVAQSVEQRIVNPQRVGSSPAES